jgi:hypothetical protein
MKGGNLGPVVIAGDPERSALFQFVSGARGDAHRMPLGGPPLTTEQIGLIRRWILEGATQDVDTSRKYRLTLPALALEPSRPIRISCRVPSAAYVELSLADSQERILFMEGGAVKEVRDATAIGAPDGWITSALRRASDWPAQLRAHLTVAYAASEPVGAMIVATEDTGAGNPDFPDGEAEVQVIDTRTDKLMFRRREHVSGGLPDVQRWNDRLPAGLYVLHLRHLRMRCEVAMLFRSRQ